VETSCPRRQEAFLGHYVGESPAKQRDDRRAVTTAATALGASKLTSDHRVASSGYLRLSNSAGDFLSDLDQLDPKKMEMGLTRLRSERDKVTEQNGKLPRSGSDKRLKFAAPMVRPTLNE
jgi:hypothetical protein